MALGPVMVDVAGETLTEAERRRLLQPLVGGVILFARNYRSRAQLTALTAEIHALRSPHLLIAVDHEGGRVQRFRQEFTRLPAMQLLGQAFDANAERGRRLAEQTGWVLAAELRCCGVDLSFTPVVDLAHGPSAIIGDRAFHRDPAIVADLAQHLIKGLRRGGMCAVAKHFPGHGYVAEDSHHDLPVDDRALATLWDDDLIPFRRLAAHGLAGVMPAHVVYPQVDAQPAGFSSRWLTDILRQRLGFQGAIFSDDLCMAGAHVAGDILARTEAALQAGCDMALVCNQPAEADDLLARLKRAPNPMALTRMARLHGAPHPASDEKLRENREYLDALHAVADLGLRSADLPLGPPVGEAHPGGT